MRVLRGRETGPTQRPPADQFTGLPYVEPCVEGEGVRALWVTFEPGSRTNWHRHGGEQLLHVVQGEGLVARREGDETVIRAGDWVHVPPGEEHWHGAGPETLMTHLAVTLGETDWLDPVTAEQFEQAARRAR